MPGVEGCYSLLLLAQANSGHFVFVGSAGAYEANPIEPMHVEGDKRKASAGHVAVENYLQESGVPFTVFQPQYIYGPHTAKDCEQWFIDRVIRDRPVPIPGDGMQLTNLTHVEDVASMLAKACPSAANTFALLVSALIVLLFLKAALLAGVLQAWSSSCPHAIYAAKARLTLAAWKHEAWRQSAHGSFDTELDRDCMWHPKPL